MHVLFVIVVVHMLLSLSRACVYKVLRAFPCSSLCVSYVFTVVGMCVSVCVHDVPTYVCIVALTVMRNVARIFMISVLILMFMIVHNCVLIVARSRTRVTRIYVIMCVRMLVFMCVHNVMINVHMQVVWLHVCVRVCVRASV